MQKQPSKGLFKKGVMRNFTKLTRKHPCQNFFFYNIDQNSVDLQLQFEFWEICKNTYFAENCQETASDYSSINREWGIGELNYEL